MSTPAHPPAPTAAAGPRDEGRLSPAALFGLARRSVAAWIDDQAPSMGAALAYYTLFSLAPLLLIVVAVAGLVFGPDAARGQVFDELRGFIGAPGAATIQQLLESVNKPAGGIAATAGGVALMLVGATTVFAELQSALDRIWRAPAAAPGGLWGLLRARVLSFGLILGLGFLLIVSLLLSAALSALQAWWASAFGGWEVVLQAINYLVSLGLMTVLFAAIYKTMPRVRVAWADVWLGALVTAVLLTLGRVLIGLYLGTGAVTSGFGAGASLVAVMVWVYYSAQIFLLGAEFTWVWAHERGSRRGRAPEPAAVAAEAPSSYSPTRGQPMGGGPGVS